MAEVKIIGRRQGFVVHLPTELHERLQDTAIAESRRLGRKVPMTEIAVEEVVMNLDR